MFDFLKTKCTNCGSTSLLDLEVHGKVGHAIHNGLHTMHHSIGHAAKKHPVGALFGLAVGGALLVTNAIVKKQYNAKVVTIILRFEL